MTGNQSKYLSYVEAFDRIKLAKDNGFYFEAVTICESIISDRLLSYIKYKQPASAVNVKTSFANLIKAWRRLATSPLPLVGSLSLVDAVDAWRMDRNVVVHGLVKTDPGTATMPVSTFMIHVEATATQGATLARKVSDWQKKEKTALKKAAAASVKSAVPNATGSAKKSPVVLPASTTGVKPMQKKRTKN